MSQLKIVDVASHQGNYKLGSYGEDGVIIKATQGTGYVNPFCDYVAQQAIKANVPWGLYHYAGGGDPVAEADFFLNNIKGYLGIANKPNLILDWEAYQNAAYGNGKWGETWLNRVKEKTGIQSGFYGNGTDASQMPASVYTTAWLWLAGYPTMADVGWNPIACPYSSGNWKVITGWQFSSTPLDKSFFYIDRATWGKLSGSGTFVPSQPAKPTPAASTGWTTDGKNLEVMAGDVQAGKVGDGPARAAKLGKYAAGVQAIVNERAKAMSAETCHKVLATETLAGKYGDGDARKWLLGNYYNVVQAIINGGANPASVSVTVRSGDTLSAIAQKYGVTIDSIMAKNGLANPNLIFAGQTLQIK